MEPKATFIINQHCLHHCHFSGFPLICQPEVAQLAEIKTTQGKLVKELSYLNNLNNFFLTYIPFYMQNRNMNLIHPPGDKYENDWRYLAVTAFLVKPPDSK